MKRLLLLLLLSACASETPKDTTSAGIKQWREYYGGGRIYITDETKPTSTQRMNQIKFNRFLRSDRRDNP